MLSNGTLKLETADRSASVVRTDRVPAIWEVTIEHLVLWILLI